MRAEPGRWRGLARALTDLCFPASCPGCGGAPGPQGDFCPACAAQMEPVGRACPCCGRPAEQGPCRCATQPPPYDRAWAAARHGGPLGRAVRDFKYRRRLELGRPLGRLLALEAPPDILAQADLWAPVPLHPWRLCWRGFNQSLVLMRAMGRRGAPLLLPDLLLRSRHTRPQVGLSPAQRLANVAGAFRVRPRLAGLMRGKAVLLVDDVFTTGATLGECARVLKAAGAARVTALTLVRAGQGHGGWTREG